MFYRSSFPELLQAQTFGNNWNSFLQAVSLCTTVVHNTARNSSDYS